MKQSNIMATTAGRLSIGAMNYTKLESTAGMNDTVGGMNMNTAGTATAIGMITTTTANNHSS
jgi:hypothetical protein